MFANMLLPKKVIIKKKMNFLYHYVWAADSECSGADFDKNAGRKEGPPFSLKIDVVSPLKEINLRGFSRQVIISNIRNNNPEQMLATHPPPISVTSFDTPE